MYALYYLALLYGSIDLYILLHYHVYTSCGHIYSLQRWFSIIQINSCLLKDLAPVSYSRWDGRWEILVNLDA